MSPDAIPIVGWIITIVVTGVGIYATISIARNTRRLQQYNPAAAEFRDAFVETSYKLDARRDDVYKIITAEVLADQKRALIKFEQILSAPERAALNAAWFKYSAGPHTLAPGSLDKRTYDIARAKAHLQALLECAKAK